MDRVNFERIKEEVVVEWLAGLREELVSKRCRPDPVRRLKIPKPDSGERSLLVSRRSATGLFRPPPSSCWNLSSRLGRNGVLPDRPKPPSLSSATPLVTVSKGDFRNASNSDRENSRR